MRICTISDIHGHLPSIDPCDILVIAGDICGHVPAEKVYRFGVPCFIRHPVGQVDDIKHQAKELNGQLRNWLDTIPAKDVVAVPGNHDFIFEKAPNMVPTDLRWHLLIDDVKMVQGKKFYGSPYQHYFGGWAYNAPSRDSGEGEDFLTRKFSMIPDDTDIIIVHGPPYGFGDKAPRSNGNGDLTGGWELTGSTGLTEAIKRVKPQLSVHGHIHMGRGKWEIDRGNASPGYIVNASICNEQNQPTRRPMYFDID